MGRGVTLALQVAFNLTRGYGNRVQLRVLIETTSCTALCHGVALGCGWANELERHLARMPSSPPQQALVQRHVPCPAATVPVPMPCRYRARAHALPLPLPRMHARTCAAEPGCWRTGCSWRAPSAPPPDSSKKAGIRRGEC